MGIRCPSCNSQSVFPASPTQSEQEQQNEQFKALNRWAAEDIELLQATSDIASIQARSNNIAQLKISHTLSSRKKPYVLIGIGLALVLVAAFMFIPTSSTPTSHVTTIEKVTTQCSVQNNPGTNANVVCSNTMGIPIGPYTLSNGDSLCLTPTLQPSVNTTAKSICGTYMEGKFSNVTLTTSNAEDVILATTADSLNLTWSITAS